MQEDYQFCKSRKSKLRPFGLQFFCNVIPNFHSWNFDAFSYIEKYKFSILFWKWLPLLRRFMNNAILFYLLPYIEPSFYESYYDDTYFNDVCKKKQMRIEIFLILYK